MLVLTANPLPVKPTPCGPAAGELPVRAWQADGGQCPGQKLGERGACVVEEASRLFATRPFTLECWLTWPDGVTPLRRPAVIAEAAGDGWTWRLCFDHAGSLAFHWTAGETVESAASEIHIDALKPMTWYHVVLALTDSGECGLAVTPEGEPLARYSGSFQKLDINSASGGKAMLAIGRSLADAAPSAVYIGSAALHAGLRGPVDFRALGGAPLPNGIRIDDEVEFANLGRALAIADDLLAFSTGRKESTWFAFRICGARDRTLRFLHWSRGAWGESVFVSEDGGHSWAQPNGGAWRRSGRSFFEGELAFTHRFSSDEAFVACSPPVTVDMADAWLDAVAERFRGRIHNIGQSSAGRTLRILEVGNPDAPIIYLQAGQHSMMERLGYYMITSAFEAAAQDAALMARTRWMIMPLVNVDSYAVGPPDGNMNRFWGRADAPPTIRALMDFLGRETERTGGTVMADWHGGIVFRGHFLLCETPRGRSLPKRNIHLKRESGYPEFEACLKVEGIDYTVLNAYARAPGVPGMFEDFVGQLPGVKAPLCIELSPLVASTPEGTVPLSLDVLRADGVRWYRAIKRFVG